MAGAHAGSRFRRLAAEAIGGPRIDHLGGFPRQSTLHVGYVCDRCRVELGFEAARGALAFAGSTTDTRVGWTVGAGIEGMITQNWTAKLEYLYMDLGRFNTATFTLAPGSVVGVNVSSKFTDNILRAGINYKFGGPVVARY